MAARDSDGCGLSDSEIRDEISTFLVAGHETTAVALTWSLALLSAYPDARQRLEDEVDAAAGNGPADPDKLPWTTAVVSEAMRHAWIPFGGGKRGCVGAGFARLEAVLVLARLCRYFRLDLTGPGLPQPRGLVTLRPATPVRMRVTRRG